MSAVRRLLIPFLLIAFVFVPVYWAFPYDLPLVRSVGIVLGWAGYGLLLGSLFLMLREARLANLLGGLQEMYLWHHRAGTLAYILLLAHPVTLAAAAWSESPHLAWQTLSPLAEGTPERLGWLSLMLLMFGLATTFATHLTYKRWRWLHFSLAIAVLVALAHLWQLGIEEPLWPILACTTLFLGWRVLREDTGLAAHPYVVESRTQVARDIVEIALRPLATALTATAGQFVLAAFFKGPGFKGCGEFHPFTLSAADADGRIRIAVKALGDCTRHLQAIETGVTARIDGAFGSLFTQGTRAHRLWLAGGIGITPFLGLLRQGPLKQPTTLVYLYRHESDAAFVPELQTIAERNPNLTLHTLATGDKPLELSALLSAIPAVDRHECYVCGPPGLVAAAKIGLRRRGIQARRIHVEQFGFR